MQFLIVIIQRLKSESPEYWKKIQTLGLIITILCAVTIGLQEGDVFTLPDWIYNAAKMGFASGVSILGVGATGTKDPKLMDDSVKDNVIEEHKSL